MKLQLEHFLPDDEEADSDESIGEDTEPIRRSTQSKGSTRSAAPPPPPPAPKDADNNAAMVRDLLWDAVLNVVSGRRFTDFAADTGIRFQSSQRQALLVLPGSGDWRRYGMIPFRATQSHESDGRAEAVFTTLRGALLEGYLRVCVRQSRGSVDIGVDLVIPKRCRRVSNSCVCLSVCLSVCLCVFVRVFVFLQIVPDDGVAKQSKTRRMPERGSRLHNVICWRHFLEY